MLIQCWSTVYDAGPTLDQHCNRSGLNCGCLFTQLLSDTVSNQLLAPSHAYKVLKINGETVARMQEIAHTAYFFIIVFRVGCPRTPLEGRARLRRTKESSSCGPGQNLPFFQIKRLASMVA